MNKTPHPHSWNGFRETVRARYGSQCAICGRHAEMWEMSFNAYPILPPKQGGSKRLTNYVWLCADHATKLHGKGEPIHGPA